MRLKIFAKPLRLQSVAVIWVLLLSLFSREYTEFKALDNVNFSVGDGEMVGYTGFNLIRPKCYFLTNQPLVLMLWLI